MKCMSLLSLSQIFIDLFSSLWLSHCHSAACSFIVLCCSFVKRLREYQDSVPDQLYVYNFLKFYLYLIFFKQYAGKRKKDRPSLLVRLFVSARCKPKAAGQLCLNLKLMFASGSHVTAFLLKFSLVQRNFRMPRYKERLYYFSVIL